MDIGLREWLVIGGVILIGLIILDGWRRMNGNRNRLRMDIDPNVADLPDEPVRTHNPELPNGGARLVGEDPLFAELEQKRESHNGHDHAESDPLFDRPDIEPDGRIEPAFGDEIDRRGTEDAAFASHRVNEEPEEHAVEPQVADNADFDELLGPARVASAEPEQQPSAEHYESESAESPVPESLEAVSAYMDGAPADREPDIEPMRFEADTRPEQDPEPLFPSLDGYDEPEIARDPETVVAVTPDMPDVAMDEGIISKARIVETRPEPIVEHESVAYVQPEPESFVEAEEPAREPEPLFHRSVDNNPETDVVSDTVAESAPPAEPVKPQVAAVSGEPELDLDKPITLLLDDNGPEAEAVEAAPLFADDPILPEVAEPVVVSAPKPKSTVKPASRKKAVFDKESAEPVPETKDLFAERPSLEKTPAPESVLAITVLAAENLAIPGAKLLPLVSACGMRFGDMDIFHRFEDGLEEGAVQFSMANAIKPGTFDIDNMDELETRGLTFFMSMEEPRDVMNAFECMLATAETVAKHMGAELLDENRSVLRPQTKEHYRQRIRDFGMRNLARRAH
ncbi:cell division protein ZipA [Pontibacterium granulatum]|uniref:cell division protein ZipA n=1 Tax=Pontibacterium granulatum TaxID=2036029 RepID=UPI00249A569F|nr:cell division protein ZipA [Pontibacterium granulatum]MDI3322851.1 cell division protein ZipA [Pontibacterium granulatum]